VSVAAARPLAPATRGGDAGLIDASRIAHADTAARFSEAGGVADRLVVDTPSGPFCSLPMGATAACDESVVTGKWRPALHDVVSRVSAMERSNRVRWVRTVVNRADHPRHARDVHHEPTGRIGCPVMQKFLRSPPWLAFTRRATAVVRRPRPATPAGRIDFFVERLVQAADPTLVRVMA